MKCSHVRILRPNVQTIVLEWKILIVYLKTCPIPSFVWRVFYSPPSPLSWVFPNSPLPVQHKNTLYDITQSQMRTDVRRSSWGTAVRRVKINQVPIPVKTRYTKADNYACPFLRIYIPFQERVWWMDCHIVLVIMRQTCRFREVFSCPQTFHQCIRKE